MRVCLLIEAKVFISQSDNYDRLRFRVFRNRAANWRNARINAGDFEVRTCYARLWSRRREKKKYGQKTKGDFLARDLRQARSSDAAMKISGFLFRIITRE